MPAATISPAHTEFADYIVFADESGVHGMDGIDAAFPMFALSFCMIAKAAYVASVVPAFQQFKFNFWGHDSVALHVLRPQQENRAYQIIQPKLAGEKCFP
jgi:hypothetical protein